MLKIRLQRVGRRNDPSFRVVAMNGAKGAQSGKVVELLGHHNPKQDDTRINAARAQYWISVGAQVSPTVHNLLVDQSIIEGKKVNVLPQKSPVKTASEDAGGTESAAEEESNEAQTAASEETNASNEEGTSEEEEESGSASSEESTESSEEVTEEEAKA